MKKCLTLILCGTLLTSSVLATEDKSKRVNKGDRPGHVMKDVIPKEEIPPAPILTVPQALKSIQLAEGFALENIVSEPNVFNPVAMTFDGDGRMWVCEMTRYMPDTFGTGEQVPEGNIAILEDLDGDGKVDKRTVFLNDIILPRTIAMVKGGIFYADHTKLYFTEVKHVNGEIVPGKREVVDPTYAEDGNLEHKTNGMMLGIDNWYYNAKSDKKYQTLPLSAEIPAGSIEIYRNQYWKLVRGRSDNRGQWGISMDDQGRLYHNGNSSPITGEYLLPGRLSNNTDFWTKMPASNIGPTSVYPIRMTPGINRGYMDSMLVKDGKHRGKLVNFTAASGSVVYRGDNFPAQYYGMAITPEPAANLISARYVIEKQGKLEGELVYPENEILASTDERFRPVNLYTAPDGSLYLLDMYHGILQHKEFLTTYLSNQIKARNLDKNNNTMGRIYRLRWQDKPLGKQPRLQNLTAKQLVKYLEHPNGWWRDTARRLIVEQYDSTVVDDILALLRKSETEATTINALWTLYGLNKVSLNWLTPFLNNKKPSVASAAVAIAERIPQSQQNEYLTILSDIIGKNYQVDINIAVTLGNLPAKPAFKLAKQILDLRVNEPLIREAIISGLKSQMRTKQFIEFLDGKYPDQDFMLLATNVGKNPADRNNRAQLSAKGKSLFDKGKKLYNGAGACFGCHGVNGEGIQGLGPTFWNTKWVKESNRLTSVMLHGLAGPIKVNGKQWQTSAVMPGLANRADFDDEALAAIATYIRNSWGNAEDTGKQFSANRFTQKRAETATRNTPYTAKDF